MRKYDYNYDSYEWKQKRDEALQQNNHSCNRCGFSWPRGLHVHHIKGAEYDDDYLEVLCAYCHAKHHHDWDLLDTGAYRDEEGYVYLNGKIVFDPVEEAERQRRRIAADLFKQATQEFKDKQRALSKKRREPTRDSKQSTLGVLS